jgi:hypothetical protein
MKRFARERPHRRRRLRRLEPPLLVDVDHHGRLGGLLRDPVLRAVDYLDPPIGV